MLFGLNENTTTTMVAVEAMHVPAHLAESFEGIAALGNTYVENLYEEVINAQGEFSAKLQKGISTGKLQEACMEVIQEGAVSNFIAKVKTLFEKLLAAIKALFDKFMVWINNKIKSDKDFLAKYRETLKKKASEVSDMEYKGHKWGTFDVGKESAAIIKVAEEVKEDAKEAAKIIVIDGVKYKIEKGKPTVKVDEAAGDVEKDGSDREAKIEEAIKGMAKLMGVKVSGEASEVVADYREKLYGGSVDAEVMTGPNVNDLISIVETYEKDKSAAEKAFQALEKSYNETIKIYTKAEKDARDATDLDMSASTLLAVSKAQASLQNQIAGVYLAALKDRRDESRAVLAKVLTYKKK